MKLFNIFKSNKEEKRTFSGIGEALTFASNKGFSTNQSMCLSTVYRAVDLISDSIAMLPFECQITDEKGYKSRHTNCNTYKLLNQKPNNLMSRFTFIKLLVQSVLLNGNGFAYIKRNASGDAIELMYIKPENVNIMYSELTGKLMYLITGLKKQIEPCNMIHIKKYTVDGIQGISVVDNACNTLNIAHNTEQAAGNFFKNGCNLSGVLTVQGQLNDKQKQEIKTSWQQAYNGNSAGNGLAVLQGNMAYQPVQINSKDSQLLESRLFNITDIARFFGISPVLLGDLSHSSYSTIEATQLAFLSQTLQPWLELIELEFTNKIFKPSECNLSVNFDDSKLIKTDKAALAAYYQQLFNISAITPNEIRKQLGLNSINGGDNTFMQLNMTTINEIENKTNDNYKPY